MDTIESQKLEYLYLIGFEFAGHVLNNYWRLKPSLSNKVDSYVKQHFEGFYVIGLQMRFQFLDVKDANKFVNCAFEIEARNRHIIGSRVIKWFISSDSNLMVKNLSTAYPDKVFTTKEKLGHIRDDQWAYEKTLIDIELFSRCHELVITGGSTYGFMASIKSQKRPHYVEGKRSMPECKLFQFYAPPRRPEGQSLF